MPDLIQRLRELRQSSQSSVVTGIELEGNELRPSIEHPLEGWLIETILDEITKPAGPAISLLVLSGNAGDGKSYLLRQLRRRLEREEGLSPAMAKWLLDATESSKQSERSVDRLEAFLSPFADNASWSPDRLHVLAMNTGTAVGFVAHDQQAPRFRQLCDILSLQLGIRTVPEVEVTNAYWSKFDRVLVVDLDRRNLFQLARGETQFFDRMLDSVRNDGADSWLNAAEKSCSSCVNKENCPVHVNLRALQNLTVRTRLKELLQDIALEDRIHISPRSLWHLIYQSTVGGLDSASLAAAQPLRTCADMGTIDDNVRASALFFNAIFEVAKDGAHAGAPALFGELDRIDPAKRFTVEMHECALSAGLSSLDDLNLSNALAGRLGVSAEALRGPVDKPRERAASAVRRAFFLSAHEPDPIRSEWLKAWSEALLEHRQEIIAQNPARSESVMLIIAVLKEIYSPRDQPGYWRLNLPWRNLAQLFSPLKLQPGKKSVSKDSRVLGPDAFRAAGLRKVSVDLADKIGSYPLQISVPLKDGPDVRITWPIYRLLRRVHDQRYVAGSLDAELVQNLDRVGASLGARSAVTEGVVVFGGTGGVHCTDDEQGGYDVIKF